jgi:hypothetical protein
MSSKVIHGRGKEHTNLTEFLRSEFTGCQIVGLSGSGGVGKTFLLRHVLEELEPEKNGNLVIWVDGANRELRGNFMGIVGSMLAPLQLSGLPAVNRDFFPATRKVARVHADLIRTVQADLEGKLKQEDEKSGPKLRKAASMILLGGSILNRFSGKTKEWVDFDHLKELGVEDHAERAGELVDGLKSLHRTSKLPGIVKDVLGLTFKDKVRTDLFSVTADAWISDLTALLAGYRKQDITRLTQGRLKEFNRLLLVIDDFEIIGKTISEFVVSHLLDGLKKAKFATHVVIVGRDDLYDVHTSFQHHLSSIIRSRFRLEPFSEPDAVEFLVSAGYSETEARDLFAKSHGFPFVLDLLATNKGRSVLFYQQFYERTTRWMTDREKEWLLWLCYLDEVNEATIPAMIADVQPKTVMDWFRNEASVRDTAASVFVVNPFIREMVLEYHVKIIGKAKQAEYVAKGRKALEAA